MRRRPDPALTDAEKRVQKAAEAKLSPDELTRVRVMRLVRDYALVMLAAAFFAGRTAAVILGLPVDHEEDLLVVGMHAPACPPRGTGLSGIRVSPALATVRTHDGVRVTSPATTWAMLATELDERALIVVGDAIVRVPRDDRGTPRPAAQLATIEQLAAAAAAPRRRHRAKLERALARIRVGSMSPLETDFRLGAEDAGLPEPRLDVEIRDERDRLLGIGDATYDDYRVVVEVEGDHHRTDPQQWARDIEKHAAYVGAGWEVVRVTKAHVRGRNRNAAAIVRRVLLRRGWHA